MLSPAKNNYRLNTLHSDFHGDLEAILDHFKPDILLGTIEGAVYQHPKSKKLFTTYKSKTYYVHRLIFMAANHIFYLQRSYG